ncbi:MULTISPECIES: spermidine synthase [Flavobacterium]|uniref:Methyltransferase domain-containing protein n=1 Tax=Flavobacterium hankyongi TaxID=1176532 RepID=A0ABP8ZI57_9FLAO|nr:spermidine synthase [Flavobacterium sp. N1846]
MNLKRILSYFIPIKVYEIDSEINKSLEVTWNNGQLVLDSKNTNFSYGSLQRVMRIALANIGSDVIKNYNSALILGVAGGSVIKTLKEEFDFNGKITGVELDKKTIEIANAYFGLNKLTDVEIINDDAQNFVTKTKAKYNLIIIDIFQDNIMPDFLFEKAFIAKLKLILTNGGSILFNTIAELSIDYERNKKLELDLNNQFAFVKKITKVEGNNEIFIIKNEIIL